MNSQSVAQHTPGPWQSDAMTGPSWCICTDSAGAIADVWTNEQDARLIAAAPELLRELQHALQDAESRLYMLPINGNRISEQKDILSAQIGRYKAAIRAAKGEL